MKIPAFPYPYKEFDSPESLPAKFITGGHLNGFDQNFDNVVLHKLNQYAQKNNSTFEILTDHIWPEQLLSRYQYLQIKFDLDAFLSPNNLWFWFEKYTQHPELDFKNFVCSFNGTPHVSRQLLVTILHRFGWFNPKYSSKNFVFSEQQIDGHVVDYVQDDVKMLKFFIGKDSNDFFQTVYSFGHSNNGSFLNHEHNMAMLQSKITQCFLHIVSESMATSYVPFVTEKFLYSVVNRGLFLTYGQPGWHDYIQNKAGFKLYTKLFDYKFDAIQNPIYRLIELMTMLSKFSVLSCQDWHDLYLLEKDNIEFNYDHYFSRNYLNHITSHANQ